MVAELKTKIIDHIQSVENKTELELYYKVIKAIANQTESEDWADLSKHHKNEIEASYKQSQKKELLINHEEAKEKLKRWL